MRRHGRAFTLSFLLAAPCFAIVASAFTVPSPSAAFSVSHQTIIPLRQQQHHMHLQGPTKALLPQLWAKPDEFSEEELASVKQEMSQKASQWRAIKTMDADVAERELDEEHLAAYKRYHAQNQQDIERIQELVKLMMDSMKKDEKQIKPKTKGQRKRDKWAKTQAYMAAEQAAALPKRKKVKVMVEEEK